MLASLCSTTEYWQAGSSSCGSCPSGSNSTGSGCSCAANFFWNTYAADVNECTPCPANSSSLAGSSLCICDDPNYYMSLSSSSPPSCVAYFSAGVSGSGPWGIWRAEHYSSPTAKLHEARGITGRDVVSTQQISKGVGTGAGATANVSWIGGGTSSQLSWIAVPSSTESTICAITRYTGGNRGRILASDTSSDWLFGHHSVGRGVVSFYGWMTTTNSKGVATNWLVMCGQNGASIAPPNNFIADGTSIALCPYLSMQRLLITVL